MLSKRTYCGYIRQKVLNKTEEGCDYGMCSGCPFKAYAQKHISPYLKKMLSKLTFEELDAVHKFIHERMKESEKV